MLDEIVCHKLRHPGAAGRPHGVEAPGRGAGASAARGHDRHGRQVRRSHRFLQVAQRGADARRHPHAQQGQDPLRRFRVDRARGHGVPQGRGRDPGAGRIRQARRRGQDQGDPVRAREQGALPRHLPRHAARGDRVRAPTARPRRRQQHRVRSRHAASGDRADHRMAGPRRPDRAPRREVRPRRHHAPGRAARPRSMPGSLARRIYGTESSTSATATATRSTTSTLPRLEGQGPARVRRAPRPSSCAR